jgi:hypothetical protein
VYSRPSVCGRRSGSAHFAPLSVLGRRTRLAAGWGLLCSPLGRIRAMALPGNLRKQSLTHSRSIGLQRGSRRHRPSSTSFGVPMLSQPNIPGCQLPTRELEVWVPKRHQSCQTSAAQLPQQLPPKGAGSPFDPRRLRCASPPGASAVRRHQRKPTQCGSGDCASRRSDNQLQCGDCDLQRDDRDQRSGNLCADSPGSRQRYADG